MVAVSGVCPARVVGVAQLVEHRLVVPVVAGSSPVIHPTKTPVPPGAGVLLRPAQSERSVMSPLSEVATTNPAPLASEVIFDDTSPDFDLARTS